MPRAFGNDERVAAEYDGDVVMPAREPSAFVMIETEFAFEVFIGPLSAPALHHRSNQFLLRHALWERAQEVVGRFSVIVTPLDQEPQRLVVDESKPWNDAT